MSNLYLLWQSTDDCAQATELNPFTHTGSLGVEEPFYLLFPFLFWFTGFGRRSPRGERNLLITVGVLAVASLVAFIRLDATNQAAAWCSWPIGIAPLRPARQRPTSPTVRRRRLRQRATRPRRISCREASRKLVW